MYWRWPWKLVPSLILAWDKIIERLRWIVISILRWAPWLCWGRDSSGCPLAEGTAGGSTSGTSAARFATHLSKCNVHFSLCSSDWKRAKSKNPTGSNHSYLAEKKKCLYLGGCCSREIFPLASQSQLSGPLTDHYQKSGGKRKPLQFTCKTWKLLGAWCFKIWSMAKGRVHNGEPTPTCECSPKSQSVSGPWSALLIANLHISPRCCILLYWQ